MSTKKKTNEIPEIDYDTSDEAMEKMHKHFESIEVEGLVSEVESPAADAILRFCGKVKKLFTKKEK